VQVLVNLGPEPVEAPVAGPCTLLFATRPDATAGSLAPWSGIVVEQAAAGQT
jgi:hypothetical protein